MENKNQKPIQIVQTIWVDSRSEKGRRKTLRGSYLQADFVFMKFSYLGNVNGYERWHLIMSFFISTFIFSRVVLVPQKNCTVCRRPSWVKCMLSARVENSIFRSISLRNLDDSGSFTAFRPLSFWFHLFWVTNGVWRSLRVATLKPWWKIHYWCKTITDGGCDIHEWFPATD